MPRYRLRKLAREYLLKIGEYTAEHWSERQSERYLADLFACFDKLAKNAMLGRRYASIAGYSRLEHQRHVVFFRRQANGDVIIVRVLHDSMLPERHSFDDTDE